MAAHTPRILLAIDDIESGSLESGTASLKLQSKQAHHLLKVMRCQQGSEIEIFIKETSQCFLTCIDEISAVASREKSRTIKVSAVKEFTQPESTTVSLIVGKPKDSSAQEIIRRGIEAGADRIVFFAADFSQTALSTSKFDRYSQIRDEACQLSRASRYPELQSTGSLAEALASLPQKNLNSPESGRLVLCGPYEDALLESSQAPVITDFFNNSLEKGANLEKKALIGLENLAKAVEIYIVVGPEGGLSRSEIELAQTKHRFLRCSLGPRVFRTDTAAVVACSIVKMNG